MPDFQVWRLALDRPTEARLFYLGFRRLHRLTFKFALGAVAAAYWSYPPISC